jgi:hypothetical protein
MAATIEANITAANNALVLEVITGVFINRDTSIPGKHFASNSVQHNPAIPNGNASITAVITARGSDFKYAPGMIAGSPRHHPIAERQARRAPGCHVGARSESRRFDRVHKLGIAFTFMLTLGVCLYSTAQSDDLRRDVHSPGIQSDAIKLTLHCSRPQIDAGSAFGVYADVINTSNGNVYLNLQVSHRYIRVPRD